MIESVEHKEINEIFKFGDVPHIILGNGSSGRTTLCKTVLREFAPQCDHVYYLNNERSFRITNPIPEDYRRELTLESLINVWSEIKQLNESTEVELPKSLLIIDDSNILYNCLNSRSITYENQTYKEQKCFKNIIMDILTRSRHYNMITCIVCHDVGIFDFKSPIDKLIFMSSNSAAKMSNSKSLSEKLRDQLRDIFGHVFENEPRYTFLGLNVYEESFYTGKCEIQY